MYKCESTLNCHPDANDHLSFLCSGLNVKSPERILRTPEHLADCSRCTFDV